MTFSDLPTLNASLNFISLLLLIAGYLQIRKGNEAAHKKIMLGALTASTLFLTSYLIYHSQVGSVPYPYDDWTRPLYFTILIPHVILAAVLVPFVIRLVYLALSAQLEKHKWLARRVLPVWMFVSTTGVVIYLMLYVL